MDGLIQPSFLSLAALGVTHILTVLAAASPSFTCNPLSPKYCLPLALLSYSSLPQIQLSLVWKQRDRSFLLSLPALYAWSPDKSQGRKICAGFQNHTGKSLFDVLFLVFWMHLLIWRSDIPLGALTPAETIFQLGIDWFLCLAEVCHI